MQPIIKTVAATKPARAVFVTYNSVGRSLENKTYAAGEHEVHVAQGFIRKDASGSDISEKRITLVNLWRHVCTNFDLRSIDLFAVYCGKLPRDAINLVAGLGPKKVVFFHCGCGWDKDAGYEDFLMNDARWVKTACGGIDEMHSAFELFLATGKLEISLSLGQVLGVAEGTSSSQ